MIIGYDGKRAVLNYTGLGNYSRLLLEVLSEYYPDHQYNVYTPRMADNPRLALIKSTPNIRLRLPEDAFGRHFGPVWRSYGMGFQAAKEGARLFHGLSGELPIDIGKSVGCSVVTVHDLIFRRIPENYKPLDRFIYNCKFRYAACAANRVIAISECTKRDLVSDYGIDPAKIDVVYQGCDPQFLTPPSPERVAEVIAKYKLNTPYIISVGTVEPRKNQLQAVKGLLGLPSDISLVIVGRPLAYGDQIKRFIAANGLEKRVTWLSGVPFADLPALYAGAVASSYTSRYEGFGIPVIESLGCGTPAVVATGSCLEEAGGPSTPAVSPDSVDQWVAAMSEIIDHPDRAREIVEQGQQYITRFNRRNMARGVMDCYAAALAQI